MAEKPARRATKKQKIETITVEIIPSMEPKLGRVYSNYVQISHSALDFTIRFGDMPPGVDVKNLKRANKVTIPNVVEVVVVPELIPMVIKALETNYQRYLEVKEKIAPEEGAEEG